MSIGGNVDAALPALNEALTCYRRLPRSDDVDARVARVERAMAQCLELRDTAVVPDGRIALNATETARALDEAQPRGALLDAYDFAVVVEEGDLAPRADSPRAAVVAALDLGELFRAKANVDASAADAGPPRWAWRAWRHRERRAAGPRRADGTLHAVGVLASSSSQSDNRRDGPSSAVSARMHACMTGDSSTRCLLYTSPSPRD